MGDILICNIYIILTPSSGHQYVCSTYAYVLTSRSLIKLQSTSRQVSLQDQVISGASNSTCYDDRECAVGMFARQLAVDRDDLDHKLISCILLRIVATCRLCTRNQGCSVP